VKNDLFYIIDAGSTKTDLAIVSNQQIEVKTFNGFNPNNKESFVVLEELKSSIKENHLVYFYGSGLSKIKHQNLVKQFFKSFKVEVFSDVLGAARATLNKKRGLIAILGTGGVVAYYNGQSIVNQKGGYGYLIDDLGGGLELAKVIVSKWLNQELSITTSLEIQNYFNLNTSDFIEEFYKSANIKQLAGLCQILPSLIEKDFELEKTILEYFNTFIRRHVISISKQHNIKEINCVGSIASNFNDLLKKSLVNHELILKQTSSKPILKLVDFHISKNNSLI